MSTQAEERTFQAEARQLLDLMIHSVYSNKDTFLRELISNASDALDKARIEAFRDKELQIDTSDLHIEIAPDAEAHTLTVRDNGIGMSRDEVVDLIGTLAKSGTGELRRALAEAKDAAASTDLIGQFGIGFYSTFMVADRVTLVTRKAGEHTATRWESHGTGTYTIETLDTAPQGTEITLHLKPEDTEDHLFDYTKEWKIREIVKRYSDFISWPIRMDVERTTRAEDGESDEVTIETVTLNSMKALWARPKDEVSDDEYKEFYRHVSHAWDEPLDIISMRAEGTFEYQALLFIPSQAPFDLFTREHARGVQLYVKRVFIMDNCEELMPAYLRFVKGVVDAQDLSLNVSREILQQDRQIKRIQKRLVKKVLGSIKDLDAEKFQTFWAEFGRVLKEGLLSDMENRETLLEIARFASTRAGADTEDALADGLTTLADYVGRMGDKQDAIYYMTGESRELIENSPHMEAFRDRGVEVLILTDPVDEVWVDAVGEFSGHRLQSIAKGDADLPDERSEDDKAKQEERDKEFSELIDWLKSALSEDIKDVRLSSRLTTSPACLVGDTFDMTPTLEKLYRASGQPVPKVKRILELNPAHPFVTGLRQTHSSQPEDPALRETAEVLYGMAVLSEGGDLRDPARFTKLIAERLAENL